MQIVHYPLRQLVPFAENPRLQKPGGREALVASIRAFGLFKPSLVWTGTDHPEGLTGPIVIGGNQRLQTLVEMAEAGDLPLTVDLGNGVSVTVDPEAIPTIVFPGPWAKAKMVALRDNSEDGEWDWDALPGYLRDLEALFPEGVDLTLTGFSSEVLADLEALAAEIPLAAEGGGSAEKGAEAGTSTSPGEGSGKTGKTREGDGDASFLTRQGARVVLGNIRGKISVETYERWAALVKDASTRLGTTDLQAIMADLAGRLETWAPPPKARTRASAT